MHNVISYIFRIYYYIEVLVLILCCSL